MPACHAGDRRFESGRVRHHRFSLRPVRPPGRGVLLSAGRLRAVKRGPLLVVLGLLAIALSCPSPAANSGSGAPAAPRRSRPPGRPTRRPPSTGPAPSSGATDAAPPHAGRRRLPDARPSRPAARRVPIVPVTQFRTTARPRRATRSPPSWPGRARATTRSSSSPSEADAILAALGVERPTDATRLVEAAEAATLSTDLATHRKRLAFLRADAVGPGVRALAWGDKTLFGVDRVTRPRRLAADGDAAGAAAAAPPSTRRDLDPLRRRRHHARPRRLRDPRGQGQGRGLPVRRRHGRDHQPLLLLRVRLGPARGPKRTGDAGRDARPHRGRRHRDRQLREPGPERVPLAHEGHGLLGRPDAHRRARRPPASTTSALANNHIRDAGGNGLLQTIKNLTDAGSSRAARARTSRPRASRRSSRRTG